LRRWPLAIFFAAVTLHELIQVALQQNLQIKATLLNLIIVPVIFAWIPRKDQKEASEAKS
jgi:hypothetical protein